MILSEHDVHSVIDFILIVLFAYVADQQKSRILALLFIITAMLFFIDMIIISIK